MASGDYDIGAAFQRIEDELIDSMMRNLRRNHLDWEDAEGFDWSQWQVEQLRYLEEYRTRNRKLFGPRFNTINSRINEAIAHAYDNGQKAEELRILEALANNRSARRMLGGGPIRTQGDAFFRINERRLNALLQATQNDMQRAEQAVLRRADDQYRKIIFQSQVYANTGAGTVQKAVDMATKDFLMRGIDCIEYKNGARHTISDWADMAIKTANKRAYLWGEGQKRREWGIGLVEVIMPGGRPCPECAVWRGKILVDDVYSGGQPDGKHQLLSEAMAAGFLHPRCKDSVETFFPWEDEPEPNPLEGEELAEAEAAEAEEARQNRAENMAGKWGRVADNMHDPGMKRQAEVRAEEWRESVAKSEDSGIINTKALSTKITDRGEVVNPMEESDYARIVNGLRAQGVEVFAAADGDDLRYLLAIGAEGTYSNGRITHIGRIPSRGTLFEEIIHMAQSRKYGELDSTDYVELYAREIEANRKLLKYRKAYKLDNLDVADIERNLASWEQSFEKETGESYDESGYRR